MGVTCCINAEEKNAYRILVGTPESKSHQEEENVYMWLIL
jgi:hypothetical protein